LIIVSFLVCSISEKKEYRFDKREFESKKTSYKKEKLFKITSLKKNKITNKPRGAKSGTTKLKNQLKEKIKVVNTKYSLAGKKKV